MNAGQIGGERFAAVAFHDIQGKVQGELELTSTSIHFTAAGREVDLPFHGLIIGRGGAKNHFLTFTHPSRSGWVLYADPALLKRPHLWLEIPEIKRQINELQTQTKSRLAIGVVVIMGLAAILAGLYLAKDAMVGIIARQVPAVWEKALGEAVIAQLEIGYRFIEDPDILAELRQIADPLLDHIPQDRYAIRLKLIQDPTLNAFALPGGTVVFHAGLVLQVDSAAELLGVLAHEIAHITLQHSMRSIIENAGLFMIIRAVLGDASGILGILTQNAAFLLTQKFSRDNEREADDLGFQYLLAAGIDPRGMGSFFRKIQEEISAREKTGIARALDDKLNFLSTHPATAERIRRLDEKRESLAPGRTFKKLAFPLPAWQEKVKACFPVKIKSSAGG